MEYRAKIEIRRISTYVIGLGNMIWMKTKYTVIATVFYVVNGRQIRE
jgi:hypothetical protein